MTLNPVIASIWLEEIESLLPEVVTNIETDELSEKAQHNLKEIMENRSEQRQWLLSLRDELDLVCQERDPVTLQRIPELLRCSIRTATGHVFCFNIMSLLSMLQQPLLVAQAMDESVARFLNQRDRRVVNPLTNLPLTETQKSEILTKANQLVVLLRLLSR